MWLWNIILKVDNVGRNLPIKRDNESLEPKGARRHSGEVVDLARLRTKGTFNTVQRHLGCVPGWAGNGAAAIETL